MSLVSFNNSNGVLVNSASYFNNSELITLYQCINFQTEHIVSRVIIRPRLILWLTIGERGTSEMAVIETVCSDLLGGFLINCRLLINKEEIKSVQAFS